MGLPTSLFLTILMFFPISEYMAGREDDIFSIFVPGFFTLMAYVLFRRFKLQRVETSDPQWEATAQAHRNMFALDVYQNHQTFYDSQPEELARLNALAQPPAFYTQ